MRCHERYELEGHSLDRISSTTAEQSHRVVRRCRSQTKGEAPGREKMWDLSIHAIAGLTAIKFGAVPNLGEGEVCRGVDHAPQPKDAGCHGTQMFANIPFDIK